MPFADSIDAGLNLNADPELGLLDEQESRSFLRKIGDAIVDFITEYRVFKVPLLNGFVLGVYLVNLFKFSFRYTQLRSSSSLGAVLLTNLLLYGLADTLAQTLRSIAAFTHTASLTLAAEPAERERNSLFRHIIEKGRPRRVVLDEADDDLVELGLVLPQPAEVPEIPLTHPEVFNFRRLALFTCWGVIISFVQSPWYGFLNSTYGDGPVLLSILQRVLVDQCFYSPISLALFFSYMTVVIEGRPKEAIRDKLLAAYMPTLAMNYKVWPAAQFVNFLFIPHALQIPFSSTIAVFWNAYLSLKNPS